MYKMNKKSRTNRTHVTPGVYFKEIEVPYASKSMGITTLGLAGETLKGPAFQPISIENWKEFQTYFGGTSTEKFRGSKYPKYELPYIAQEYLKQSNQLEVVRTLGLSGVNAGPAWVITATKYTTKNGYVYEQSFDDDENAISLTKDEVYSKINPQSKSILINELGCYNDLYLKTPKGIPSSSYNENTIPNTVYVLDGNIIDNYKKEYQQYINDVPDYVMIEDEAGFYSRLGFANIDESVLEVARENAERAGVDDRIKFFKADARKIEKLDRRGTIVCNPPYGERLMTPREAEQLYRDMGKAFSKLSPWQIYILTSAENFQNLYGKRADKVRKLYNGMIPCSLYQYFKVNK